MNIFYQNLVSKLDSYNSINNAWKVESLMSVKDIIELDVTRNFKSIINEFIENNKNRAMKIPTDSMVL